MSQPPNEHELPDDIDLWPSDPAMLFGISRTGSRRDLKRAYSRLIRRFKPEHAPEQFRRLREAFEQLDQQLEWREVFHERDEQSSSDPRADHATSETDVAVASPERSDEQSGANDRHQDDANADLVSETVAASPVSRLPVAEHIWREALSGASLASVYQRLVDLASQQIPSEIEFARLYWLLTMDPLLDPHRDAIDWLIEGLRKHGLNNRLLTMLTIDVRRRQGDVPALLQLNLNEMNCSLRLLVELLQSRWMVVRHQRCFERIRDDLSQVQSRFFGAPVEWQMVLLAGVRHLLLVPTASAIEQLEAICNEFNQLTLDAEGNWLWDWYESSIALQRAWQDHAKKVSIAGLTSVAFVDLHGRSASFKNVSSMQALETLRRLIKLVQGTWGFTVWAAREQVLQFCSELLKDSESGFRELAAINQIARPLVLRLLVLIREQFNEFVDPIEFEATAATEKLLARFVKGALWRREPWHLTVLEFCLQQAVTPTDVATALEKHGELLPHSRLLLIETLQTDLPLHCLVEGQRLIW